MFGTIKGGFITMMSDWRPIVVLSEKREFLVFEKLLLVLVIPTQNVDMRPPEDTGGLAGLVADLAE